MRFRGPVPTLGLGDPATYNCPCCGERYKTLVVGHYDFDHPQQVGNDAIEFPRIVERATIADGTQLAICDRCHQPCCPRCEHVAGEGMIVCTRCTTFPGCAHSPDCP